MQVRIKFSSSSGSQQPQNGRVLATDSGIYSIYLPSGSYSVAVELSVEQVADDLSALADAMLDNVALKDLLGKKW